MLNTISGFWLSPTYGCNNRCRSCYVGGELDQCKEAKFDDLVRYGKQMVAMGAKNCILIGGEPTTYGRLVELVETLTGMGLSVKIVSNGRRLSDLPFAKTLLSAGLCHCTISLEGLEPVHDAITRVAGSFRQAVQGVRNCQEAGIRVNTITTVSSFNRESIEEIVVFLRSLCARKSVFNMCSCQPSGYKKGEDAGVIELSEYVRIVSDIGLRYDNVVFYSLVPLCLFDQDVLARLREAGRIKTTCALLSRAVAIDPDGNILPCTHMAGLNYGNMNSPGVVESLADRKQKEIAFLKTHAPSKKCVSCRLWNTCFGGCNLIWFSRKAENHICGLSA